MTYKILKNKKFHIPIELLKEVERDANEQQELEARINAMSDEEYEDYLRKNDEEAEREIERGEGIPWEVVKQEAEEDMRLIDREYKNYIKWKTLLEAKRQGVELRYII